MKSLICGIERIPSISICEPNKGIEIWSKELIVSIPLKSFEFSEPNNTYELVPLAIFSHFCINGINCFNFLYLHQHQEDFVGTLVVHNDHNKCKQEKKNLSMWLCTNTQNNTHLSTQAQFTDRMAIQTWLLFLDEIPIVCFINETKIVRFWQLNLYHKNLIMKNNHDAPIIHSKRCIFAS